MNVPKLRFKEFTDEWIKIDLSTCFEYFSTNSLSREQLSDHGIIKNIHYGDIHKKYGNVVDVENDVATYIKDTEQINKYEFCCENDIIFADASEDYDGIGKAIELINVNEKLVSGLHTIHARDKKQFFSPLFKGYYFNTPIIHNQIRILANGFKVFGISKDNINNLKVMLPSKQEQDKIAKLLSLLDKKIELQAKKIEDLKLFKKGLISKLLNEYNYEIMKIKDVLKFEQPTKYIVNSDDYINDSKAIPVLTANKAFILGYCNDNNFYDKGDSIIFDDFTMDMKYTNFNYKIKSSAIKILTAKDNNDLRFLYELLLSLNLKSEEHKRHYISIVQEMDVKIPSIEVQNSISSKLELVDNKILFEKKFLDNLTKLKKGFMQNMFV